VLLEIQLTYEYRLMMQASSADVVKESFMHMETREGNNTQIYHASVSEKNGMGARPDSEPDALSFSQLPESGIRSTPLRPKLAYNPLAVEQGRQRHLLDGSKPSSWSTSVPELDLQRTSQYGNRPRSQDNQYLASLSSPLISEQPKVNNIAGGATTQSSATPATKLPLHYQVNSMLPIVNSSCFFLTFGWSALLRYFSNSNDALIFRN
jgi:hypothetical protein